MNRKPSLFTARLTIDVTPGQRGRIKVTAFRRGLTVADMLRSCSLANFPTKMETRNEHQLSSPQPAESRCKRTHPRRVDVAREAYRALDPLRPNRRGENSRSPPAVVSFAPGAVFAFVRWASNDFGTIVSRIDIVRAVTPGEPYSTLPFVRPGGEILLRIDGWPKVIEVLQAIDAVEVCGVDPADAAPDHWRHVHNRLTAGEQPRPYTLARHKAWLMRRSVAP